MLLALGAKTVTTFDYTKITSHHPQLETLLPKQLAEKYFSGIRYDVMVTFSSLEHSGLGRFVFVGHQIVLLTQGKVAFQP